MPAPFSLTQKDECPLFSPAIDEVFSSPTAWTNDYPGGNNWPAGSGYGNGNVLPNGTFLDTYEMSDATNLNPHTSSTSSTLVRHNNQTYYGGGTGTAGYSANGALLKTYTVHEQQNEGIH